MKDLDRMFEIIRGLDFPRHDFVITGGAALFVRGLREEIQDLDIVARGPAWKRAMVFGPVDRAPYDNVPRVCFCYQGFPIEVTREWFPVKMGWNVDQLIERSEEIQGVNFMPLEMTVEWKRSLGREKDFEDIALIEASWSRPADGR